MKRNDSEAAVEAGGEQDSRLKQRKKGEVKREAKKGSEISRKSFQKGGQNG